MVEPVPVRSMSITCADQKLFSAYLARPSVEPAAAVILIMEMFGVNEWLRGFADWLAQSGYLVIAPDMFHRQVPNLELTNPTQAEYDQAFRIYKQFDYDQGVQDLIAAVEAVRQMPSCNGKVGTLGFCFGGKLAHYMATRSSADCHIGFYPVGLEQQLAEPLRKPFMLQAALSDPYISPEAQEQVHRVLAADKNATIYDYAGCGHAFLRPSSEHYNAEQAQVACKRTLDYLQQHLLASATEVIGVR